MTATIATLRAGEAAAVRRTALHGLELGLSVVVVHAVGEPRYERDADGTWTQATDRKTGEPAVYGAKVPCGNWRERQTTPATAEELDRHLGHPEHGAGRGIALVCGYGGVELFEFDDEPTWQAFHKAARRRPEVWEVLVRVANGYWETSPRGAPHFLVRCEDLAGGGVLARRPEIVEGVDGRRLKVLIETRGPGQTAMIAPTGGTCHPTGRPYRLRRGGLESIAVLTPAERTVLYDFAREFDELPPEEPVEPSPPPRPRSPGQGEKPGDHFNRVCTLEMWQGMLAEWRWQYVGAVGSRPHCWAHATASSSLSAHLTPANTLLVFSTSVPLRAWTPGKPTTHTAFHVFAAVSHGGRHQEAARALAALGYGHPGRSR